MSIEFIEILDTALEQLRKKDPIPQILERYPDRTEDLTPLLHATEALESIQSVEMPSQEAMKLDRNNFLATIIKLENSTVSPGLPIRIKEWIRCLIQWPQNNLLFMRKENWNMNVILARTVLVICLLFGATGGAYALADNSLPNEPLYGAKLAMEQAQLRMKTDPADIAGYHLVMAQHRIKETIRLMQAGKLPDEGVMTRLENHLNTAFQLAAQLGDDGEMQGVLTQAKNMLQKQTQAMNQIQVQISSASQAHLQMMMQLMTQAQYQAEMGLQDSNAFRWQVQNGAQSGQPGPGQPGGNPDCPLDGCVPEGDENKYGQTDEEPPGQPGGNPDCPLDGCVPAGDENKYGQTGGNPDCPLDGCVPEGDENKYGQTDEGPPGQPGGNPDCPLDGCVPAGDENQYGQTGEEPPGQPGGNPDCPLDGCVPEGDENKKGQD